MLNQDALWRACEPMREDGMPTARYIDQLSALLFLKGAEASGKLTFHKLDEDDDLYLPDPYRWDSISNKTDVSNYEYLSEFDKPIDSDKHPSQMSQLELYQEAIAHLKQDGELAQRAFDQFTPDFRRESTFRETVNRVDQLDGWSEFSGNADLFGDAYEFLIEKYADKTEGTGEYYTPRPLIRAIVEFVKPNIGAKIIDPAAGTNGFLIYAYEHIKNKTDNFSNVAKTDVERQFVSRELRMRSYRYGLLNYILHDIDPNKVEAMQGDSLREEQNREKEFDLVLANPPFGSDITSKYNTKSDSTIEMNFLMMMMDLLNDSGRAGIVIPEGILFDSSKEPARIELLNHFNLDVILALPENTFQPYSGVDTNVLFFERDSDGTDEFWFYDARSNYENIKDSNPLSYQKHFSDFINYGNNRGECEGYFKVDVSEIDEDNHEMYLKKYKQFKYEGYRPPDEIANDIKNELESIDQELSKITEDIDE